MTDIYMEDIVKEANRITNTVLEQGGRDKRVLALCIEINQRYREHLEEFENNILSGKIPTANGVRIAIEGEVIEFKNMDDFSAWLASELENGE